MLNVHNSAKAGYPNAGYLHREVYREEELARHVTEYVYGAAIWAGGARHERNFCAAYWCVLDFDEGVTKLEALAALEGYRYVLGPSKSDGLAKVAQSGKEKPACDRFRVLVPFAQPIFSVDVFRYNMRRYIAQFRSDAQPYDGGRVWQPCKFISHVSSSGKALDVELNCPVEETQAYQNAQIKSYMDGMVAAGQLPRRVKLFIQGKIAASTRNPELFFAACTLFQFGWTVEQVKRLVDTIPEMRGHDKTDTTIRSAAKRTGAAYF